MDVTKCISAGILLVFSLLMLCVEEGLSIKCVVCNSHKIKACEDNPNSLKGSNVTYHECPSTHQRCRKITQEVDKDYRVVRQCAENGEVGCISRTGTYKIKMEYCECTGDGCNSASGFLPSTIQVLLVASLALLRMKMV